jgi:hypothetical protein
MEDFIKKILPNSQRDKVIQRSTITRPGIIKTEIHWRVKQLLPLLENTLKKNVKINYLELMNYYCPLLVFIIKPRIKNRNAKLF